MLSILSLCLGLLLVGAVCWAAWGALSPPPPPKRGEADAVLPILPPSDRDLGLAPTKTDSSGDPLQRVDTPEDNGQPDPTLSGLVMGAPAGSAREGWQVAVERLGLEYPGDQDREVRAAIRLVQAIWLARHGDQAQMPVASQRFAVTVALGNPERIADLMGWDKRTGSAPRPPLPPGGPARDDVELALAGVTPVREQPIRRKNG